MKRDLIPAKKALDGLRLKVSRYSIPIRLKDGSILLYSSRSHGQCKLNKSEAAIWFSWEKEDIIDADKMPAFARVLFDNGFLVADDLDEVAAVQRDYMAARADKQMLMLTIAPTMGCNLACGYCFQGLKKDLSKLDRRVPGAIMEMIERAKSTMRALNVTWYGGEPLMAKRDIFSLADQMISFCDRHAVNYSSIIVTNGYFLDVETAQQLWSRRCTAAQVTIDGVEATHDKMRPLTSGRGSFKMIVDNLSKVMDKTPLNIALRVNVGKRNLEECNALLDMFLERGFNTGRNFNLYFSPIDAATSESGSAWEEGLTKQEYNEGVLELERRARRMGLSASLDTPKGFLGMCVAARENGYVITHTGDVHKCWETAHDPRKRIGTVFELDELNSSLNNALWQKWTPFDNSTCRECKILPMCGGHCGHRFLYTGAGNENALPCPNWKWNTAEYLFDIAKSLGVVTDDDWLESEATLTALQSGARHSPESLAESQKNIIDAVNSANFGVNIDRGYILHGDGRSHENKSSTAVPDLNT